MGVIVKTGERSYQYVDSYEIMEVQLDQAAANYNALGASDTKGCANCQWFLPPGRCAVVAGQISPTGISDLWMAKVPPTQTPLLVEIVGLNSVDAERAAGTHAVVADHPRAEPDLDTTTHKDPKKRPKAGHDKPSVQDSFYQSVKGLVAKFGGQRADSGTTVPGPDHPFTLYRQKDDRLRFLTAWSNNFTDREGEIFPESAHKEYIEWADRSQQYPELWLWHTKGTKYGQVDWVDYTDGYVFASGLIDAGFEDLALRLSKEDCGVSHGFHGLQRGKEIVLYRPFEISTLPRTNAAVWTTSFNIIGEGAKEMAFTEQKKSWLKDHGLDDAAITAAETQATNLSKALRDAGVAYKDTDLVEEVAADKAKAPPFEKTDPKDEDEDDAAATKKKKAQKDADFELLLVNSSKQFEAITALAATLGGLDSRLKAVEKTDDEKIAASIAAARPSGAGVAASKDATNVVSKEQVNADADFFGSTFVSPLMAGAGVTQ